jgi:hypothetical protein
MILPPSPQSPRLVNLSNVTQYSLLSETTSVDTNSSRNRKRRLSDADSQPMPKRPRGLHVGPRLHAVSDPLPLSSPASEASKVDNWFQFNFDIPDAVIAEDLDPSTPVEVDFFKDWTLLGGFAAESPIHQDMRTCFTVLVYYHTYLVKKRFPPSKWSYFVANCNRSLLKALIWRRFPGLLTIIQVTQTPFWMSWALLRH